MKILITGHRGFIGSKLYDRLEQLGHEVIGFDKKDRNEIQKIKSFPKVDIVYHLAAHTSVINSLDYPREDAEDNIMSTIIIADKYKDTRIIYTTSAASVDPISPYGISKKVGELYIRNLCTNFVICRLPNVYDKTGNSIISKLINDKEIVLYGNGIREYVHVDDIVEGLVKAIFWTSGSYNLGNEELISLDNLAEVCVEKNIEFKREASRKGEKINSYIGNNTPNWHPKIKLKKFLDENINNR